MAGCKESREAAKRPSIVPARTKIRFPWEESLFEKGNDRQELLRSVISNHFARLMVRTCPAYVHLRTGANEVFNTRQNRRLKADGPDRGNSRHRIRVWPGVVRPSQWPDASFRKQDYWPKRSPLSRSSSGSSR